MTNVIRCNVYLSFTNELFPCHWFICKLFSYSPKPIHALLASKRRPIDLQEVPFWRLT